MRRLIAASALFLSASEAMSANFTIHDEGGYGGAVRIFLSGEITSGDLRSIKNLLSDYDTDSYYDGSIMLYLNSPGGNYLEGLEIAEYIRKTGIATRVDAGSICNSACALIFMHGISRNPDEFESLDRELHSTAKVGFHAPYLRFPESVDLTEDETREVISYSYSEALRQFSRLLESSDKIINTELLVKMLRTPRHKLVYIETMGDLAMWKVNLLDEPPMTSLRYEQMAMACHNVWAQDMGYRSEMTFEVIQEKFRFRRPELSQRFSDGGEWYRYMTDEYSASICNLKISKVGNALDIRFLGFTYSDDAVPEYAPHGRILSYIYFQEPRYLIESIGSR